MSDIAHHVHRDVSRETPQTDYAQTAPRRRRSRSKVERNGRLVHIGPAWSEAEIATIRTLVAAGCLTVDIAAHFKTSPQALSAMMHRQRILRRHPTVAEVLAGSAPSESLTPAASGSASVAESGHQGAVIVEIIDRFEKHVCEVELREIDDRRQCRVVRRHGDKAGQWATFPLWQIRFYAGTDRKQAIAAAIERGRQVAARRKALHQQSSNNGESDNG